jgi:hypothetical protein
LFTGGDFILANSVYISHSTKDREAAGEICAALEADGIRCWIAPRDIKPGEEWPLAICKAITSSEAMIIIFSILKTQANGHRYPVQSDGKSQTE